MILKAIKEGRTPTPGPPAGGMDGVRVLLYTVSYQ